MTPSRARKYKTAWIIDDAWELPEDFDAGECVSVEFLRKVFGACVFQCRNIAGSVAAISEFELERFVF